MVAEYIWFYNCFLSSYRFFNHWKVAVLRCVTETGKAAVGQMIQLCDSFTEIDENTVTTAVCDWDYSLVVHGITNGTHEIA